MAAHDDFSYLAKFESFGANCEFGFVQERCAIDVSSLFRWAEIPSIHALINLLRSDFSNLYSFDNLTPFNAGMVRDAASGVAWHSVMRSTIIDPTMAPTPTNFAFIHSEDERRSLWKHEVEKIKHLTERTRAGLKSGDRIYVYKSLRNHAVSETELRELHAAIRSAGGQQLLFVSATINRDEAGSATMLQPDLVLGKVDRFAPGSNARDVSLECWLKVCSAATCLLQNTSTHNMRGAVQ